MDHCLAVAILVSVDTGQCQCRNCKTVRSASKTLWSQSPVQLLLPPGILVPRQAVVLETLGDGRAATTRAAYTFE